MLTEVQWQVKSWGVAGAMFPPTFYIIITITTILIIIILIIIITNTSTSLLTGIRTNYESTCAVHHKWEQCERTWASTSTPRLCLSRVQGMHLRFLLKQVFHLFLMYLLLMKMMVFC